MVLRCHHLHISQILWLAVVVSLAERHAERNALATYLVTAASDGASIQMQMQHADSCERGMPA